MTGATGNPFLPDATIFLLGLIIAFLAIAIMIYLFWQMVVKKNG